MEMKTWLWCLGGQLKGSGSPESHSECEEQQIGLRDREVKIQERSEAGHSTILSETGAIS